MPKATWSVEPGTLEPLVPGRPSEKFLMTLEPAQLIALDKKAREAGLSRNAYVRKALYHYMNCEGISSAGE